MNYIFQKAAASDLDVIWNILQQAIARRKNDGSSQWQDGYPNRDVILNDIAKEGGYVLTDGDTVIGYCAVFINDEPEYEHLQGRWLTDDDFVVFHRLALSEAYVGKGLSQIIFREIEGIARQNGVYSVRADTNYDNLAMLKLFDKMGYTYCGEVHYRGSARKAFEKVLTKE